MKTRHGLRAAILALACTAIAAAAATAAPQDYEFQLVNTEIKQGDGAVVALRLVDKRSGAPVENAVIFATRMDMEPEGMEAMTTPVEAFQSAEPGIYRFKTNLVMAGGWRFSVAAKVQGETGTVESRLDLAVLP